MTPTFFSATLFSYTWSCGGVKKIRVFMFKIPWPAICYIWLGKRTVPVYLLLQRKSRRCIAGRDRDLGELSLTGSIDDDLQKTFCLVICLSFVWRFFFPSRSNNRLAVLIECSKLTCFAKKKSDMVPGRRDRRSTSVAVRRAGQRASWKRGK